MSKKWGKIGAPKSAKRKAHLSRIRKKSGKGKRKGRRKARGKKGSSGFGLDI